MSSCADLQAYTEGLVDALPSPDQCEAAAQGSDIVRAQTFFGPDIDACIQDGDPAFPPTFWEDLHGTYVASCFPSTEPEVPGPGPGRRCPPCITIIASGGKPGAGDGGDGGDGGDDDAWDWSGILIFLILVVGAYWAYTSSRT